MGSTEAGHAFSRAGLNDSVRPTPHLSQQGVSRSVDHLNPATEEEVAGGDGLSHHGDPEVEGVDAEEPEVEVLEEPEELVNHSKPLWKLPVKSRSAIAQQQRLLSYDNERTRVLHFEFCNIESNQSVPLPLYLLDVKVHFLFI